jgi:uncharacterized protein
MSEIAPSRSAAETADAAVKAYIRMNRERLAADGELLSLLAPDRGADNGTIDFCAYALEKLRADNQALRAERDALKSLKDRGARLSDGVRRAVLDLIEARSFTETVAAATAAAAAFGADRAVFCLESGAAVVPPCEGLRRIAPGTVTAVVGPEGAGAILSGGGELLFGRTGYRSIAAFRVALHGQPALYVLGSLAEGRFEGRDCEAELGYFARALERAIRAWLDLPKS